MNEQDELERPRAENERLRESNKRMRQVLDAIFIGDMRNWVHPPLE
ncbi:MAG: hypothetical protein WA592_09965 [Pseudolabrys sp.]